MMRSSRARLTDCERTTELRLGDDVVQRILRSNTRARPTQSGERWVDTGADTCCVGQGFHIEQSGRFVTLRGYSDRLDQEERVPVVTATTAVDLDDGSTLLLVFHEALFLGNNQRTSLLNLNQVRCAGHKADDIPQFISQGRSIHGIETIDGDYLPFTLKGKSSLLYTRLPTAHEMDHGTLIDITSDEPWDPNRTDWEGEEEKYTRKHRKSMQVQSELDQSSALNEDERPYEVLGFDPLEQQIIDDVLGDMPQLRTAKYASRAAPVKSSKRHPDVDFERLRRIFGVTADVMDKTLLATTHLATRSNELGLHRRFKTKFTRTRHKRLDAVLYSDTFSSNVTSTRGNNKTQGFVIGTAYYVSHYPMPSEGYAAKGLAEFVDKFGVPAKIHTDNSKVQTQSDWKKFTTSHWITCTTTEPYTPNQNRCEHEFGQVRIRARTIMEQTRCPEQLWDYVIEYVCYVRNRTSREALNGKTPMEVLTGDTPDISDLFDFEFFEPVSYMDNPQVKFPERKVKLGRWLGIAESVGQAMCYYILTERGTVIARSTVGRPEKGPDPLVFHDELRRFDNAVREVLKPTDLDDFTEAPVRELRRKEALKVARKYGSDDNDESVDGNVVNRHTIYSITDTDGDYVSPSQHVDTFYENEPDPDEEPETDLTGVEVLTSKGGQTVRAKVKGRKRDCDGTPVAADSTDEALYIVEYPDGSISTEGYNALLAAISKQVDEHGEEFYTFQSIVGHKRLSKGGLGDQRGWFLRILWKTGEYTWEPLTSIKEDNPFAAAEYAADHNLLSDKAFKKWAPYVLRKANRFIRAAKTRKKNNRYKFGIEVPRNLKHALELDAANGNTFWADAVKEEMQKLSDMNVFNVLEKGERAPKDYKTIPTWIIFDVKMGTFRRKARLVAGGHVTEPPTADTYSSVASKESVRLSFLISAINALDLVSVDITNAYVHADCREKVATIAGPEFGEYEGYTVLIVKALYGLKSSGAAWHAHLSERLRAMKFIPSRADSDMWMREATRDDGLRYYEYICSYVDDLTIVSHRTAHILQELRDSGYELKGGGAPETFLGATIGRHTFKDGTTTWYQSAEDYLKNAIKTIEEKLKGPLLPAGRASTPLDPDYHPEIDETPLLDDDRANYYQSLIGILLWACQLGRIDIVQETGLMARFGALPKVGHLEGVMRMFSYLKKHLRSRLVYDPLIVDMSDIQFTTGDWAEQYPDAEETIPHNTPEPLGNPVKLTVFCDASHADCLVTRRSTTGILIFANSTPIQWYSKRQNTVESSTYGSEFVAMRIATEMLLALRHDLRMLGIPLDGPADLFCDNMSVVLSSTIVSSVLKKKHNAVAFHKVRETVASEAMQVSHENTQSNLADLLSKSLNGPRHALLTSHILH